MLALALALALVPAGSPVEEGPGPPQATAAEVGMQEGTKAKA